MFIKLVLSQDAQLGIRFKGKAVMLHLLEGPVTGHITEDSRIKSLAPGGKRTIDLSLVVQPMLIQAIVKITILRKTVLVSRNV